MNNSLIRTILSSLLVFMALSANHFVCFSQTTYRPKYDKGPYNGSAQLIYVYCGDTLTKVGIRSQSYSSRIASSTSLWYLQDGEIHNIPVKKFFVTTKGENFIGSFEKDYYQPTFSLYFNEAIPFGINEINISENKKKGYDWKNIKIIPRKLQPKICINEDSLILYLSKTKDPFKGIYECISYDEHQYKLAFIEKNGIPTLVYLGCEKDLEGWQWGDLKATLRETSVCYLADWYMEDKTIEKRCVIKFDNRSMEVEINGTKTIFVKLKDNTSKNDNAKETIPNKDSSLKSTGSGFIISGNIIATNHHVVENADRISVVLYINGEQEEFNAKVLATDKTNDLALLSIKDTRFIPMKPAPYDIVSNTCDVGTSVFTMGYPLSDVLGEEVKITDGLINSKTGFLGDITSYQISAPIQPGNSGGALFDKKGHLIGITNAGIAATKAENIGYAIKSSYLLNLIDSAPIEITLPKGVNLSDKDLPYIIKEVSPYITLIKIY